MRRVLRFSRIIAQEAIISDTTMPGAERLREPAERQVGDAGHRRQDDRRVDRDAAAQIDRRQSALRKRCFVAHDLGNLVRGIPWCNAARALTGRRTSP